MKNFIKKYSVAIAIICSILFLAIFLTFLFQKKGDTVYISAITGKVSVGSSADATTAVEAFVGMKLDEGNIVMTGDRASCVLSYEKKADSKDNFITVCEDSQVNIYGKNKQGGYNFFVTYGSVISNMTTQSSYTTNLSSKLFNLSADGLITKVDYDRDNMLGNIYVFDGNGMLQIIQPSGSTGRTEKLIKNSATAVQHMEDGTVGFGQLNFPFGLDSFSAQDLKIMSGVANNWSEKISYGVNEFEQAFQTASDYAEFMQVDPVVMTTVSETVYDTLVNNESNSGIVTTVPAETTVPQSSVTTKFMGATQTVPGMTETMPETMIDSNGETVNVPRNSETMAFSEFERYTVMDLGDVPLEYVPETQSTVTTVPFEKDDESNTRRPRETEPYVKETTGDGYVPAITTAGGTNVTTTNDRSTSSSVTKKPAVTTVPSSGGNPKPVVTTVPPVKVDPNAAYTVIFTYSEGGKDYWAIQLVRHGQSAIPPEVPEIPGKHFQKWDKDFSCVTSNMTINGIFADGDNVNNYYTVNLYVNNELWKTVTVKHGDSVKLASEPKVAGKTFSGWSSSLNNITSDKTVFALFVE